MSCANWRWGYFNVYNMTSRVVDLDFIVFLGDWIYEYSDNQYPPEGKGPRPLTNKRCKRNTCYRKIRQVRSPRARPFPAALLRAEAGREKTGKRGSESEGHSLGSCLKHVVLRDASL